MAHKKFKKVLIFYRHDMPKAERWHKKIARWIQLNHPKTLIFANTPVKNKTQSPDLIIALGGDGTILEAAQKYHKWNPVIAGLNLGHVGFTATARKEKDFLKTMELLFAGKYSSHPRLMISASLKRAGKTIAKINAINEISVQHLLGMVDLKVQVAHHPLQYIKGNGVLVATATGSTAYNLSAHGPIVMPDIRCFIITEIMDHNIPTPSIVIKRNRSITITVEDFRKQDKFIITKTKEKADVILAADSYDLIPLQKGDVITIKESRYSIRFAEIEKNYFFKSLQEKFAFQ